MSFRSGRQRQMVGLATMYRPNVFVSIVTVSIVFHLICLVRFCDCCGCAEVDCRCTRSLAIDYRVFAEGWGFPGTERVVAMLSRVSSFLSGDVGRKPDCCFAN